MPRDYYDVLGVPRDADEAAVKKAFRRLARELHPDVNAHDPDAEAKFKEAAEAYEVLSDPDRRQQYDAYGHEGLRTGGYAPNFGDFGSISDLFSAFFGARSYLDEEGRLASGFAVVAWPVIYDNSGVMTFQVNQQGIVYQKDLGDRTSSAAAAINTFDPDRSWAPTSD